MEEVGRRLTQLGIAEIDHETPVPFSLSRSNDPSLLEENNHGFGDSTHPCNTGETQTERVSHRPASDKTLKKRNQPQERELQFVFRKVKALQTSENMLSTIGVLLDGMQPWLDDMEAVE